MFARNPFDISPAGHNLFPDMNHWNFWNDDGAKDRESGTVLRRLTQVACTVCGLAGAGIYLLSGNETGALKSLAIGFGVAPAISACKGLLTNSLVPATIGLSVCGLAGLISIPFVGTAGAAAIATNVAWVALAPAAVTVAHTAVRTVYNFATDYIAIITGELARY